MASEETFESVLKEAVNAKRLSASKMTKLTDLALQNMENDTQLVSALYRTHKSLHPAAKISSLYVFDALCRAARSQVSKLGLTGDIHAPKGNCASFLLKVEGVLDGLVQDMVNSGYPDAKEKTKKILDIWSKAGTFPAPVLSRLMEAAKADKDTNRSPTTTSDPRLPQVEAVRNATPPTPVQPQFGAEPAQAALLALLTAAKVTAPINQAVGQTSANNGIAAVSPALDPLQLALLQQLANKVNVGSVPPVHPASLPVPSSSLQPPQAQPGPSIASVRSERPPLSPTHREKHPGSDRRDPRYSRFDDIERGSSRDDAHDYGGGTRGGFRGRGGGRDRTGGHGNGDWSSKDRRRQSSSRSRSPPRSRFSGRSEIKPYSPPRRPSVSTMERRDPRRTTPDRGQAGKDEFGRDIRSSSPDRVPNGAQPDHVDAEREQLESHSSSSKVQSISPINQNPEPDGFAPKSNVGVGLDQFDISTFDFTNPKCWESLADAFKVTNGYTPSQEELMALVSGGIMAAAAAGGAGDLSTEQMDEGHWEEQSWDHGGGRGRGGYRGGRGRGRGRGGHANGAIDQSGWGYGYAREGETDPTGGDYMDSLGTSGEFDSSPVSPAEDKTSKGGTGGQMQKIGDRWVFVREGAKVA